MKLIVEVVKHIEDHLHEDLSVQDVAKFSGYSSHHFQKMFAAVVGMSLGTYIRRRRLTKAAQKLFSTECRIIEIAQESGFDSQEAFSRAFKAMFAITPNAYREQRPSPGLHFQQQIDGEFLSHLRYEGVTMQPKIEERDGFFLVGLGSTFERGKTADIGRVLWPRFEKRIDEIRGIRGESGDNLKTYGVCQEIWENGQIQDHFRYFAAVEVEPKTVPPKGLELIQLKKQNYAIFEHRGGLKGLQLTNQYIWGTWLTQSGYELAPASDLEIYPGEFRPDRTDVPIEIWLPLQRQPKVKSI